MNSAVGQLSFESEMRRITTLFFIFMFLSVTTFAQSNSDSSALPKTYWLKYSLIFFSGCQPIVSPSNITFDEGDCVASAYDGKILPRGTEVQLTSIDKNSQLAKISFTVASVGYEVLLKQKSEKQFSKAFGLLFIERKLEEFYETKCPDDIKTKRQLIRCLGFPITATRNGDVEEYFYIIEFTGSTYISSYDGFTFKIKNGKIIDLSGYI